MPEARLSQHSGVQLLLTGLRTPKAGFRIIKAGWEEWTRQCKLVGKEGICLSRGFTDSPCLHQIEDILGEEAKELLYTPQTRPGRSLPDTISVCPVLFDYLTETADRAAKGNIIRILSKCQHSHVSEQADIVFGTLSTDTILPITRTLPIQPRLALPSTPRNDLRF
ncbi:hypothetical protein BLNAU_20035 [Blattamonas nauphoetae]|uniref:Uncharacterized protein n=1 Tax=Blattamonas nauphoetae TaxID=2049346 RepID=A0ABQ9X000_9EUKA|nr:hypothetical protein BLNAU_20035 [Blattamonas nauphoetae]